MAGPFTVEDLDALAECVAEAWCGRLDRDWGAPAGTVEWSCSRTADHAVDALLAPAFFLASRRLDAYPEAGWSPGESAEPRAFVEGVEVGARILGAVVRATPPDTEALLFRNYRTIGDVADFAPRGALELALHAHDVCVGLGVDLDHRSMRASACEHTFGIGRSGATTGRGRAWMVPRGSTCCARPAGDGWRRFRRRATCLLAAAIIGG